MLRLNLPMRRLANANQGGLFDMMAMMPRARAARSLDLGPGASPGGCKERLTQEKNGRGFYLSGHLFDEVEHEVRNFIRTPLSRVG